jgi:hypothetical protein
VLKSLLLKGIQSSVGVKLVAHGPREVAEAQVRPRNDATRQPRSTIAPVDVCQLPWVSRTPVLANLGGLSVDPFAYWLVLSSLSSLS